MASAVVIDIFYNNPKKKKKRKEDNTGNETLTKIRWTDLSLDIYGSRKNTQISGDTTHLLKQASKQASKQTYLYQQNQWLPEATIWEPFLKEKMY